ncbi:MAG: hypothetical protein D6691_12195 [Candidatus Hydrogenedentota bacterium]|uniref:VCBS repeat-containing protein n=1 Tax=Sumerlaea chitinivorans TaxID=2250252 RepID=A0A2Z4YAH7_SUMC1|nr:hypothetical protein BRCON_2643 [Candidatus Sumerlaea chitinivorans]RMH24066.1 MAG: hypothetical protein D6691_12195 [Candidatus Hydrogenedentota bacterium]
MCLGLAIFVTFAVTAATAKLVLPTQVFPTQAPQRESTAPLAQKLRPASAMEDEQTSAGIMHILEQTARAVANVRTLAGHGTFLHAGKVPGLGERALTLRMELAFERPRRMALVFSMPTTTETIARFVADGKTVLMEKRDYPLGSEKPGPTIRYRQIPQPPSLSCFAEEEFEGEIIEDFTEALSNSGIGGLLLSAHPLEWLHAHVVEYFYDGVEQVAGTPCYRIRFLQKEPELMVVTWVDAETYLPRKVSVTRGIDGRGQFFGSFAGAQVAEMRVATFETLTTAPLSPKLQSLFNATPSPSATEFQDEQVGVREREPSEPFLVRLLRAAASSNPSNTTITLTTSMGRGWRVARVLPFSTRIIGISRGAVGIAGPEDSQGPRAASNATTGVVVACANGELWRVDARGERSKFAQITPAPDLLVPFESNKQEQLAVSTEGRPLLRVFDSQGKVVRTQQYHNPLTSLLALPSAEPTRGIRLIAGTKLGAMFLREDGMVAYMNCRVPGITDLSASAEFPEGAAPEFIAANALRTPEILVYETSGSLRAKWQAEGTVIAFAKPMRGAAAHRAIATSQLMGWQAPDLVAIVTTGEDLLMRGFDADGKTLWTGIVELGAQTPRVFGAAAGTSAFQSPKRLPAVHYLAVTAHGTLADFDERGQIRWRGKLDISGGAEIGSTSNYIRALAATDLDADGKDELYIAADAWLVVLTPESPQ